jgi:N-acetylneuraminate epimerase
MNASQEMVKKLESVELDFSWPDFPVVLREAVGARVADTLYAGLGSAGAAWYALDLQASDKQWQRRADFPGVAPAGAAFATLQGKIFVFGGNAPQSLGGRPMQSDSVWCYEAQADAWQCLPLTLPLGLLGASAIAVSENRIWIFGGYNKQQFDRFFVEHESASEDRRKELLQEFMGRPIAGFAWNRHVWEFNADDSSLRCLSEVPHAPNCGAGLLALDGGLMLLSGEVKPGLRSATVKRARFTSGGLVWDAELPLPVPPGEACNEGLAAGFFGNAKTAAVFAGGTNFIGATQNYLEGKYYAHAGLKKRWRDEIYIWNSDSGSWQLAAHLPKPRAHGLSFELDQGLLLVGGDGQDGSPLQETCLLSFQWDAGHNTGKFNNKEMK